MLWRIGQCTVGEPTDRGEALWARIGRIKFSCSSRFELWFEWWCLAPVCHSWWVWGCEPAGPCGGAWCPLQQKVASQHGTALTAGLTTPHHTNTEILTLIYYVLCTVYWVLGSTVTSLEEIFISWKQITNHCKLQWFVNRKQNRIIVIKYSKKNKKMLYLYSMIKIIIILI